MKQTSPRASRAVSALRTVRKPLVRSLMAVPAAALLVPAFAGIGGVRASATTSDSCPCSIWNSSTTPSVPASGDGSANELGVKFESSVAGQISGVSFYKGAGNGGTHVGHLWSSGGKLLASVTFSDETASGWQTAYFSSPVSVQANTVYVASYYDPQGHYADDVNYFANSATSSGPLTALRNGTHGANGVYRYRSSGFPTSSYSSANYWVDVVFTTGTGTTTTTSTSTSTTSTTSTTVASPPAAPSGLTANASSDTAIALTWSADSGASSYQVRRSPNGSTWTTIATVTSPGYGDTGLTPSTSYSYDVVATSAAGSSAPSATASTATMADTTPPSVPSGLAVSAPNSTTANLSWSASTDDVGVAGYTVFRNGTKIATTTGTSYSDTTVAAGTAYSYTVSAYDAAGNQSGQSTPVSVTTPAAPACSGVIVASGADIQSAVNSYGSGTTFCIEGTHYIGSAITPKAGDTLIGTLVSGYSGPENALIDGQGTSTYAIAGNNVGNVTVKDLAIEHFVGGNEIPVLGENNEGSGWDIENNYVAYNTYEGIFAGAGSVVKGNHVEYNNQLGISGYQASNAQITGNEVDHNGSSQYTTNEGGGIKLYQGSGPNISNNYVHDNVGTGIWLDTDVVNATVNGNTVANNGDTQNSSYGIQIEITCNDTVTNNTISGTTTESNAIFISSSHDVVVSGNTMTGTRAGVTLWGDNTRTTQAICGAPTINNDQVSSNTETLGSGSGYTTGVYLYNGGSSSGAAPTGDVFSGNAYHAPDCSSGAHFQWYVSSNSNYSFSGWQTKVGQDSGATCTP